MPRDDIRSMRYEVNQRKSVTLYMNACRTLNTYLEVGESMTWNEHWFSRTGWPIPSGGGRVILPGPDDVHRDGCPVSSETVEGNDASSSLPHV